jgi:predicted RNase H-like HicB family nuclease
MFLHPARFRLVGSARPISRPDYFIFRNAEMPNCLFIYCFRNFTVHPIDAVIENPLHTALRLVRSNRRPREARKEIIMNRSYASITAVALAALIAMPAFADSNAPGKTREQVKAELAEAIRTGDISANDYDGRKLNELYPSLYPQQAATPGKTRAQVKAELAEAIRTGDISANDYDGRKLNELYPSLYPQKAESSHTVKTESSQAAGV